MITSIEKIPAGSPESRELPDAVVIYAIVKNEAGKFTPIAAVNWKFGEIEKAGDDGTVEEQSTVLECEPPIVCDTEAEALEAFLAESRDIAAYVASDWGAMRPASRYVCVVAFVAAEDADELLASVALARAGSESDSIH